MLTGNQQPQQQSSTAPSGGSSNPSIGGMVGSPAKAADVETDEQRAERALVKQWCTRIKAAKKKFDKDFKRMTDNMAFAAGYQWEGQDSLTFKKYIANITIRNIAQKVATLYARDPQAVSRRRERLNYQLWDGKMESLISALGVAQQATAMGMPLPPEATALMADFQKGQMTEQMLDKVAATMKIVYHYQMDEQEPTFKEQLKQLVATTCTCFVGYSRMSFVRDATTPLGSTQVGGDIMDRVKRLRALTEQYEKDNCSPDSPITENIRLLASSLVSGLQDTAVDSVTTEKIVWDFPSPLSIIVDPACKALMGFIGAKWVAQEYILPITEVNSYFELRGDKMVKGGGDVTKYDSNGKQMDDGQASADNDGKTDETEKPCCAVYEICNINDRTRFFIVDGHKDFVQAPAMLQPKTKQFWPWFGLTFNRIAIEQGTKATIYGQSDVDLMRSAQKNYNSCREESKEVQIANAPFYCVAKSAGLTEDDKQKIASAKSHEVLELAGLLPGQDIRTILMAFPTKTYQPELYDVRPCLEDVSLTIGTQSADLGQQQHGDTATGQQISEQSRLSTTASNVDDLDGFLTRMARAGGEILLREMSPDTVTRIAGPGAVWPQTDSDKQHFIDSLYLETEAASSGRPNQALEMKQWQAAAPVLQQNGANPQFMVRKTLQVLDSRIEPSEAFPLTPPAPPKPGNAPKPTQADEQTGGPQPQANNNQQPQNPRNQQQQ